MEDQGRGARSADYIVPANGSITIAATGGFVRCLVSAIDLKLIVDDRAQMYFAAGMAYSPPNAAGFKRLELVNETASATTVTLAIGWGELKDDRVNLSGTIPVKGTATTFTDNGNITVGTTTVTVLAANASRTRAVIRAGINDLWLGPTSPVSSAGEPTVPAGGEMEILHTGIIWGIRAAGSVLAGAYEEAE
jgi:hypothetical protein